MNNNTAVKSVRSGLATWMLATCLVMFVEGADAQSTTADTRASCSASFHLTCIGEDVTVNISGSGAPLKEVGDSAVELIFLAALVLTGAVAALRRRAR